MALVNRTFQRDLVLSASHLKAESVHFEYFGYNEEIDFLIYILNVLVISLLFLKSKKKKIVSGNPFCCVTVIHCILLLSCYSMRKVIANKRDY